MQANKDHDEPFPDLLPHHLADLKKSGISDAVIRARGYFSATTKQRLLDLGFKKYQALAPALVIPLYNTAGAPAGYQIKPDRPRTGRDGRLVKYELPERAALCLDTLPDNRQKLLDPDVSLLIVEGVKKADCCASKGILAVALVGGIYGFMGLNEYGGRTVITEFDEIARNDARLIYLVPDSDAWRKPEVYDGAMRIARAIERRSARVSYIELPDAADGTKQGPDDFLDPGKGWEDLFALAKPSAPQRPAVNQEPLAPEEDGEPRPLPYRETPHGIVWDQPTANGPVSVPLTNFPARIVAESVEDDGVESRRLYEVEANHGERTARFPVPAHQFDSMTWHNEHLGSRALVYPGQATRDRARAAIRLLSGDVPERRVYTHLGFREVEPARFVYLHAGIPIGQKEGEQIEVRLPDVLQPFELATPPTGNRLHATVRASLGLIELAPDVISIPIFATVYRAPLGDVDLSVHLSGPTSAFKSELAALMQQHYGRTMDVRRLPAAWSATDNSLELLAFQAKDALLVIDDFVPVGSAADVQRLHAKADRVLRSQGNRSGRGRLGRDLSLRPTRPPRGMIVSTGEDVPHGQSLRARLCVLELAKGDISPEKLTACQKAAAAGLYAESMAAYLAWLGPRYASIRAGLRGRLEELRDRAQAGAQHRRTPNNVAQLALGLETFLQFAQETGTLSPAQAAALWERGWKALGVMAAQQSAHQQASEPARRFVGLIGQALASGRAHLAARNGAAPPDPEAWGWRKSSQTGYLDEWKAQGERIGWIDDEGVYLLPDPALKVARSLGGDGGEGLQISGPTLHKRLKERGLLLRTDTETSRKCITVRVKAEGKRPDVLHLAAASLMYEKPDQPDHPDQLPLDGALPGTDQRGPGRVLWSGFADGDQKPDHKTRPEPAIPVPDGVAPGQDGRVGRVLQTDNTHDQCATEEGRRL